MMTFDPAGDWPDLPRNNVLRLLYPAFERFLAVDLQTTPFERTEVVELAAVACHLPDRFGDCDCVYFSAAGRPVGDDWPPTFDACRERVEVMLRGARVHVAHDDNPIRDLRRLLPAWR